LGIAVINPFWYTDLTDASRTEKERIFSLPYIFRIGTLMNAENADFFLFISENQRFSASKKAFVR
jgi:hypothetical protein